jgi:hypothetical protein
MQNVVLHNFLPNSIIGFAVTEKCDVINPVAECEPGPPTTGKKMDHAWSKPGHMTDPPEIESVESMLGIDDDMPHTQAYLEAYREAFPVVPTSDDEVVKTCMNCDFQALHIHDEPCDGCFDQNAWKGMPVMDDTDNEGMPAPAPSSCDGCPGPDEVVCAKGQVCRAGAESLYRAGCWVSLENRKHDLMSEWSLAAPECKFQFEAEDRDEILCSHDDHSLFPCHFDECPRMKA